MEYKVLINLFVPEIEENYEMYIPINKTVGEISELLTKIVHDLSKVYPIRNNACLCNRYTGIIYERNILVRNTDIRNGTEIIIF